VRWGERKLIGMVAGAILIVQRWLEYLCATEIG